MLSVLPKKVWDQFERPIVRHSTLAVVLVSAVIIATLATLYYQKDIESKSNSATFKTTEAALNQQLASVSAEFKAIKEVDQVKLNQQLLEENKQINETFKKANGDYQSLLDLKIQVPKLDKKFDENYAKSLKQLADRDYKGALDTLGNLEKDMQSEKAKLAPPPAANPASNAPVSNAAPGSGYSAQKVSTDRGEYSIQIIAADLNSTKVIVDTASDSDCRDNCPVLSLGEYASRSGAYAGINGNFFCPASYPSCAGKTNSFDTLVMNKNKTYFNSDNNVYSTVPAAIFSAGSARFVGQTQQWGRDTGVDAVIANYPLYIAGGNNNYGGSSDPKIESKGTRTFIASKGSMVYIGIIYGASAGDAAAVLKTLGMDNAMGLDQGGSTALWNGGKYLAGPGRGIPNAVLFVRR
jgi:exopolysaccharide biosynthesis protein